VAKEVFRAGNLVRLKPQEYLLLEYLAPPIRSGVGSRVVMIEAQHLR